MDGNRDGLVGRSEFATTDPETAEDFLRQAYMDTKITGWRDGFAFAESTASVPGFSINRQQGGVDLAFECEATPDDFLLVSHPMGGRIGFHGTGYSDTYAYTGDILLCPPIGLMHSVAEPLDQRIVVLDRDAVAAYAAAMTGLDPDDLLFDDITPLTSGLAEYWVSTVTHICDHVLADPWSSAEPLVLDQAFRSLSAGLLSTFPNSALARVTDPEAVPVRGEVSAATLREVVDYLNSHADQPIGPTEVAALAGMPTREIVEGLRRRRGIHPAQLLYEARLTGARRDLLDADPEQDTAVAAIAARWGFTHRGRFRVVYASVFGEPPEATLHR